MTYIYSVGLVAYITIATKMVMLSESVTISTISIIMALMPPLVNGSRFLLTPFPSGSHVAEFTAIGEGLADNGHDVHILLPPVFPGIDNMKKSRLHVIDYERREPDIFDEPVDDNLFYSMVNRTAVTQLRANVQNFIGLCSNVLGDDNLFKTLQLLEFDIGIVDIFPITRCYLVLMYRLGLPYHGVTATYEPWLFRNPALPSFVRFPFAGVFNKRMNFRDRLRNTWHLLDWVIAPRTATLDDNLVTRYAPEKPAVSMNYLATRAVLWLFNTDVVLDYPRPVMANEVNIGGLTAGPAKPLPADLNERLHKAVNGTVIVSFGSMDIMTSRHYNKMMEAFTELNHLQFIWRYKLEFPGNTPSHITLRKWIPQNDLLGHPNVKLFICHGGTNSQFESLYHSVPMITIPLCTDQPYNAKRTESKGIAITMNIHTFTADELTDNILRIVTNTSYQTKIEKLSKIYHSRPMSAKQRAVYWIEHVLEHGGEHLMSAALDMAWYEYLMLDIAALVFIVMLAIIMVLYKILTAIMGSIKSTKQKKA